jgi:thioredoxin 1
LSTLAAENDSVLFLKVDVDELEDTAAREGVSAMPTFFFFKGGRKVAELVGSSEAKLKELVAQHK